MPTLLDPYRLVIFDWDGTLIDSPQRIINCVQQACKEVGCTIPEAEAIRSIIGLSLHLAFKEIIPNASQETHQAIMKAYRELFFYRDTTPMPLFEGVRECLAQLEERGHLIAIATGKSRAGLDRVLEQLKLVGVFHTTRCADETASKPDPCMLYEILEELDIPVGKAVMIGDSSYDLEMAQNASMDRIAVTSGAHKAAHLEKFDPIAIHPNVTHFISKKG